MNAALKLVSGSGCMCGVRMCMYIYVCVGRATALKAGGRGFESHLSSLFSMKMEKGALRFVALFHFEVHMHSCVKGTMTEDDLADLEGRKGRGMGKGERKGRRADLKISYVKGRGTK